jgi:hypothetical protein
MLLPDEVAVKLVAVMGALEERLGLAESLGGDPVLTVVELCARWKISERVFYRDHRTNLPVFKRAEGADPRYLLSDVVAYERGHRFRDGTLIGEEKRSARRRAQTPASAHELFSVAAEG